MWSKLLAGIFIFKPIFEPFLWSWRRRGVWGTARRVQGGREMAKLSKCGGGWYERMAVTVRLTLSCYQVFLGVV